MSFGQFGHLKDRCDFIVCKVNIMSHLKNETPCGPYQGSLLTFVPFKSLTVACFPGILLKTLPAAMSITLRAGNKNLGVTQPYEGDSIILTVPMRPRHREVLASCPGITVPLSEMKGWERICRARRRQGMMG